MDFKKVIYLYKINVLRNFKEHFYLFKTKIFNWKSISCWSSQRKCFHLQIAFNFDLYLLKLVLADFVAGKKKTINFLITLLLMASFAIKKTTLCLFLFYSLFLLQTLFIFVYAFSWPKFLYPVLLFIIIVFIFKLSVSVSILLQLLLLWSKKLLY